MGCLGKCACQNCTKCCLSRIDVEFAVPEPGEPGAAFGTWGWDVDPDVQPTADEVAVTIEGSPVIACRQTYSAPNIVGCPASGTHLYNVLFKTKELAIDFTYWQQVLFGNYFWFEGQMLWRTYAMIKDLKLEVYRYGTLARTVLSGLVAQLAFYQPTSGSRRRQYATAGCGLVEDVTFGTEVELATNLCAAVNECKTTNFFGLTELLIKQNVFAIQRDSGWVTGDCGTLPVNDTLTALNISSGYNPSAAPGTCRMPSGSTYALGAATLGCTQGGTNFHKFDYNYSAETVWFARHPIDLTYCP